MIGKMIKNGSKDLWIYAVVQLAVFIFGIILFTVIMAVGDEESVFELATAMMVFVVLFMTLFFNGLGFQGEFNLAVGMGVTRKHFIIGYYISALIMAIMQTGLVYVFHFIESAELGFFYPGLEKEAGIEPFLFSWYVIPAILIMVALSVLIGAVVMRVGKTALIVLWVLWMAGGLLPSRIEKAMESGKPSLLGNLGHWLTDTASGFTPIMAVGILGAMSVIAVIVTVMITRKQRVTA